MPPANPTLYVCTCLCSVFMPFKISSKLGEGEINRSSGVNAILDSPGLSWGGHLPRSDSSQTCSPGAMCLEKYPERDKAALFLGSGSALAPAL